MLAELDLLIRGAVIGISALVFVLLWWSPESRSKSYSIGAIAFTLAGALAAEAGPNVAWSKSAYEIAATIGHFMPFALTWFILDVFLERAEEHTTSSRALVCLSLVVSFLCFWPETFPILQTLLPIALDLGLLYLLIMSAQGDLVERRRSFRVVFVSMMVAFGIGKTLLGALLSPEMQPVWGQTFHAAAMLGFVIIFAHWALRPGQDIWTEEAPRPMNKPKQPEDADNHVLGLIKQAMHDEIWRREGLTIGAMAEDISIPEHRLRKAINRDLGYRNFSAFVNGYRIEAAKAALTAPENAQITILEIAYDVGFASLGPFNKAFRAMTGTSPRDYRRGASDDRSIPA